MCAFFYLLTGQVVQQASKTGNGAPPPHTFELRESAKQAAL